MSFSLRELFAILFVGAFAFSAIRLGGYFTIAMMASVWIAVTAMLIVAFVDSGAWKAFAIGFVATFATILIEPVATESIYMDSLTSRMSVKILPLYSTFATQTGEPSTDPLTGQSVAQWQPSYEDFTTSIAGTIVVAISYAGGKFASMIQQRRKDR